MASAPPQSDDVPTVLIGYPSTLMVDGCSMELPQEFTATLTYMSTSVSSPSPPLRVHYGDLLGLEELDAVSPFQKDVLCHHACHASPPVTFSRPEPGELGKEAH